jgi:hypothetical protein
MAIIPNGSCVERRWNPKLGYRSAMPNLFGLGEWIGRQLRNPQQLVACVGSPKTA